MKKITGTLLLVLLVFSVILVCGCGTDTASEDAFSEPVSIACLNGPTGLGMAAMPDNGNYSIEIFQAPTDAVAKIISKEADVACVPSNLAAVLYNKTEGGIVCVTPMVMGVLHILQNGNDIGTLSELKGHTVISSGKGGTPEYALQAVLSANGLEIGKDVKVEWLASHADVNARLLSEEGAVAMVPEPFVSSAIKKSAGAVTDLFDMNTLWAEATGQDFPMGVLIARREFVESHPSELTRLLTDLKASIDTVNSCSDEIARKIVDKGFLGDKEIALIAIPNLNLCLYTDSEGETSFERGARMMKSFNETLFDIAPESVGGALPGDDLYYTGE